MKRSICVLVAALVVAGCSTTPKYIKGWKHISPGQSRAELIEIMGQPHEFTQDQGHDILVWEMDRWEKCAVFMSKEDTVMGKTCKDNAEARARAMAAMGPPPFMMMGPSMPSNNFKPVQGYQPPRPLNTNCMTNGNITNCTTQPGGVDTSIYR